MAAEPVREVIPAPPEATPAAGLPAMVGKVRNTTIGLCRHDLDCPLSRASTKHASGVSKASINVRLSVQHKCHFVMPPLYQMFEQ